MINSFQLIFTLRSSLTTKLVLRNSYFAHASMFQSNVKYHGTLLCQTITISNNWKEVRHWEWTRASVGNGVEETIDCYPSLSATDNQPHEWIYMEVKVAVVCMTRKDSAGVFPPLHYQSSSCPLLHLNKFRCLLWITCKHIHMCKVKVSRIMVPLWAKIFRSKAVCLFPSPVFNIISMC